MTCRWTWRTHRLLPCCLHMAKMYCRKNTVVSPGITLTLQTGGAGSVPRVLAMPVLTLSEKMWEILFSCSGFAKTTIRMFHNVWIATWRWIKSNSSGLHLFIKGFFPYSLLPKHLYLPWLHEIRWDIFFNLSSRILSRFHLQVLGLVICSSYKCNYQVPFFQSWWLFRMYLPLWILCDSPVWSWGSWCSSRRVWSCPTTRARSEDPPESRWHRCHAECDQLCRLVSCLGLCTGTKSWCCVEGRHFLCGNC